MRSGTRSIFALLASCAITGSAPAQVYQVGATASAVSPGCQDTDQVPLTSQPNASALASCVTTGSATASAQSDLPTATVSLLLEAMGGGSNAAGQPQLVDAFLFQVPPGLLAPNEPLLVGVTFTLDGSVTAAAVASGLVSYGFGLVDFYNSADPDATFLVGDTIGTAYLGPTDFSDTIEVRQPFLEAQLTMSLAHFSGITAGLVDLVGSVALDLPPGVTWTSRSGVLLTVPEPSPALGAATAVAMAAWLAQIARARRGETAARDA